LSLAAKLLLGVALVAAALFLSGLGGAPFVDPPEGFHAVIARDMLRLGDWVTPHVNGMRYFDKPPLLYWMMAVAFRALGPGEGAARLGSALPAVGVAVVTAWIGMRLAGLRVGLIAGLVVAANLELYLFARLVKPDLVFVLCIVLAFAGFVAAYLDRAGGRGGPRARWALLAFYAALAASVLAKDVLGAVVPLLGLGVFFALTGERAIVRRWVPWAGVLLFLAIAAPWYLVAEIRNPGFLWYTVVDNHILNVARQRVFPDEDVPLGALEFLAVTAAGFAPWCLALPMAVWRRLRRPWASAEDRVWLLLSLWAVGVLGLVALSPFKLPHYGLPAFPAFALLVAKLWDEVLEGKPGAPSALGLLVPPLMVLGTAAFASFLAWQGRIALPDGMLASADVAARNVGTTGGDLPFMSPGQVGQLLRSAAMALGLGALGAAVGLALRRPVIGLGALLAAMLAFLPISAEGFSLFARSRSARGLGQALALRATPADILAHEGPLENSGAWLMDLDRPVKVVNGLVSNLAFGATFPEARDTFWDAPRLEAAWMGPGRVFLLSGRRPEASVVRGLPPGSVHLILQGGGRWLYSNRP
jgi:4-amino-4-deoxy-L-arabinose transferase-like glycosyltransferase